MELLYIVIGLLLGGGIGWYVSSTKFHFAHAVANKELEVKLQSNEEKFNHLTEENLQFSKTIDALRTDFLRETSLRASFESRAREQQSLLVDLKQQIQDKDKLLSQISEQIASLKIERAELETKMREAENNFIEQKRLLTEAEEQLKNVFNTLATEALKSSSTEFLKLAQERLGTVQAEAKGDLDVKKEEIKNLVAPLSEALKQYQESIGAMEKRREHAYGGLTETLRAVSETQNRLQLETTNLVNALRKPQVKGRWGEITLQRVVELAGMSPYCDFEVQVSTTTDEGRLRPDMIVRLPNQRIVVVDAKVSLSAYLDATADGIDDQTKITHLQRHAQLVRSHMRDLSSKSYWNQFPTSPDFVVMFLPGDPFLSAALEHDRSLIEDSIANRVLLSTPTTLVAVLRAIAFGWKQEQLAENAQRIADEGKVLFERLTKFVDHFDEIRKGLEKATQSFNQAARSWDSRVLPSARRLKELGAAAPDKEISDISLIEQLPQGIVSPENDQ